MSTLIRPEVSKRNEYYIPKDRYYELKYFCRQYPDWKRKYNEIGSGYIPRAFYSVKQGESYRNPTFNAVAMRETYFDKMKLVEDCAKEADPELYLYILDSVTKSYSYKYLRYTLNMPCAKGTFYNRYRKFFYILDKKKGD